MAVMYDLGIAAYTAGIRLAAPFHAKARLWVRGRKGVRGKIREIAAEKGRLVWFHAASLGEFEQGRPVMEALKRQEPETRILLTFFSPSGYEVRKNYSGADYILYLPADTPSNARFFVQTLQPAAAVFIKYEFWYNYLNELHRRCIPTYLISAIFRKEQPFFKSWGGLHRRMLGYFTRLFVQDSGSVRLLASIGVQQAEQTGDTRFDRVKQIAADALRIEQVEQFLNGAPALVCGSTWGPDEELLLAYMNDYSGPYKLIIAPHEIHESRLRSILDKCRKPAVRFSRYIAGENADVLIIDCIGLLSSVYRYGKIAYIGGGFGAGIHNTPEAAVYGIPVLFGPKFGKFREAVELKERGGAFSIRTAGELKELLDTLTASDPIREAAGRRAGEYVNSQLGATAVIVRALARHD